MGLPLFRLSLWNSRFLPTLFPSILNHENHTFLNVKSQSQLFLIFFNKKVCNTVSIVKFCVFRKQNHTFFLNAADERGRIGRVVTLRVESIGVGGAIAFRVFLCSVFVVLGFQEVHFGLLIKLGF